MPGSLQAWYSLRDVAALADREVELSGETEVAKLSRLSPLVHAAAHGRLVAARLCFGRTPVGTIRLELSLQATVGLVCQRCLEIVEYELDETIGWSLTETQSGHGSAGEGLDELVLERGRFRPIDLLEDELIVSLPMVPRHASIDECGALAQNLNLVREDQGGELTGRTLEVYLGE